MTLREDELELAELQQATSALIDLVRRQTQELRVDLATIEDEVAVVTAERDEAINLLLGMCGLIELLPRNLNAVRNHRYVDAIAWLEKHPVVSG